MGKIQVAQGDLSVAVAKKNRLSRAKEILMMRSGIQMNSSQEMDFKRSIDSFVELIDKSQAEVVVAEKALAVLVLKKNELLGIPKPEPVVVKAAVPVPEPVAAPKVVVPEEPKGVVDPAFDKLLPDTLQELPTDAPAAVNAGLFD